MKQQAVMTTSWDDGHPLDLRVAELLAKYGLTGTFYVPLNNSRPVLPARQIQQLAEAFEVGAHTVHHATLTEVSDTAAAAEIRESKQKLEEISERPCEAFCFPKGRFRRAHVEMVRGAGFRCARTVELLSTGFPEPVAGIDLIPATVQACTHTWTAYGKNCAKRLAFGNVVNFVLRARSRDWTEIAHSMLRVVVEHGGVFHLWGHSWEVDEQHLWPKLESILSQMSPLRFRMPPVTNSSLARMGIPTHRGAASVNFNL
jgi:peptidoglycan-N-acetylglucosamine deacetylase